MMRSRSRSCSSRRAGRQPVDQHDLAGEGGLGHADHGVDRGIVAGAIGGGDHRGERIGRVDIRGKSDRYGWSLGHRRRRRGDQKQDKDGKLTERGHGASPQLIRGANSASTSV
jgi:hypothetical protein